MRYTSQPTERGTFIAYDRELKEWVGFLDGAPVPGTYSQNVERTRRELDSYVFDLLRREAVVTADARAEYAEAIAL